MSASSLWGRAAYVFSMFSSRSLPAGNEPRFGLHFGRFGRPFGVLLAPGWSIWLHFDVLKLTLDPTTPKNIFVVLFLVSWLPGVSRVSRIPDLWGSCFGSFTFWIAFKRISTDLCTDLGIVVSLFLFGLLFKTQSHKTPNPTTTHPQT